MMSRFLQKWKHLSRKAKAGIVFLVILGGGALGFLIWAETPPAPMAEALSALGSDSRVTVNTDPYIIFTPVGMTANTSLIIYPGGRVDPRSYAPAARNISIAGFLVIITPMPLNLAVFAPDKAKKVMARYPTITKWVIGGHSLGGSMAAQFASQNPTMLTGLVLWASYPAGNISTMPVKVLSISGSRDGLSTPDKIAASRANLPPSTKFVEIQGGNHGQFGWYGDQLGDNAATITRVEQQAIIVNETLNFLTHL